MLAVRFAGEKLGLRHLPGKFFANEHHHVNVYAIGNIKRTFKLCQSIRTQTEYGTFADLYCYAQVRSPIIPQ